MGLLQFAYLYSPCHPGQGLGCPREGTITLRNLSLQKSPSPIILSIPEVGVPSQLGASCGQSLVSPIKGPSVGFDSPQTETSPRHFVSPIYRARGYTPLTGFRVPLEQNFSSAIRQGGPLRTEALSPLSVWGLFKGRDSFPQPDWKSFTLIRNGVSPPGLTVSQTRGWDFHRHTILHKPLRDRCSPPSQKPLSSEAGPLP